MTTREQIIAAAKEADSGFEGGEYADGTMSDSIVGIEAIERFYAIAFEAGRKSADTEFALAEAYRCGEEAGRQAEREACAVVCELTYEEYDGTKRPCFVDADECANAIRARSGK